MQRIVLFSDNILEFRVDNKSYFGGDFYGFRRAPVVLELSPGDHRIDVRLVRDVRAMGGSDKATIAVTLEAHIVHHTLTVVEGSMIMSDVVDETLPSPVASINVRNNGDQWIEILGCNEMEVCEIDNSSARHKCLTRSQTSSSVDMLAKAPLRIAPGQTRALTLEIIYTEDGSLSFALRIDYRTLSTSNMKYLEIHQIALVRRSSTKPHKMTFLHPSGAVSYAILRPPTIRPNQSTRSALPVLLNLHGAGLEADSHQVRHMLDSISEIHAWVVFPTGMSPWSGDDWHTWGFADVQASVSAIERWIDVMEWTGPRVLIDRWLVSGHSNGGQGTWHIITHQPDKIIAAAPVSAYLSIQNYVPYAMWTEATPLLTAVVQNSMSSFRHELLVENLAGIPILQQHGSADKNVPPYHSRLMASLRDEYGLPSDYVELTGMGHWFEGAMATTPLQHFYRQQLGQGDRRITPPKKFSIIIPSSGEMGSCWGIVVDQLETPDINGRIDVQQGTNIWHIHTSNIHRLHLKIQHPALRTVNMVIIDDSAEHFMLERSRTAQQFEKSAVHTWNQTDNNEWKSLQQRYGRQRGALDAIMRTKGSFQIVMTSKDVLELAVQLSRNLFQYYGADSEIVQDREYHSMSSLPFVPKWPGSPTNPECVPVAKGNVILIVHGPEVPPSQLQDFPIHIQDGQIELDDSSHGPPKRVPVQAGLGAIFLRPLREERLEVVVWGADEVGLRQAARLVPTLTGVGQPDFIILGNDACWRGIEGALAMGFFDYQWKISKGSYLPRAKELRSFVASGLQQRETVLARPHA